MYKTDTDEYYRWAVQGCGGLWVFYFCTTQEASYYRGKLYKGYSKLSI